MKEIQLTRGLVALVDDWNYDWLNKRKWHALKTKTTYYAASHRNKEGKYDGKYYYMHREIMNTPSDKEVDHRDHNGLNCQEFNMRNCIHQQNICNKKASGASKYLGVSFVHEKYITAKINMNKRLVHLGYFKTEEAAARAYDVVAKKLYGEFANLNFKD
jgi:hypothetical protein